MELSIWKSNENWTEKWCQIVAFCLTYFFCVTSSATDPCSLNPHKNIVRTYPFPYSAAHLIPMVLGRIGLSLHCGVMLTGLGGRLGSTPGLLVGMGLGSWTILPLTWTFKLGGNSSETSLPGSVESGQNRSWTWGHWDVKLPNAFSSVYFLGLFLC